MSSNYLKLNHDPFEFENRFYCFVGDTSSDPSGAQDDENIEAAERAKEFNFGAVAPPSDGGGEDFPARTPTEVKQQTLADINALPALTGFSDANDEDELIEAQSRSRARGLSQENPRSVDRSFFADAYDGIYGTPSPDDSPAIAPGASLSNLMSSGPMSQIFSAFGNNSNTADDAAFNVGQLLAMGGTRNPDTGAITGANAGDGTLGMNRFGMVTYSGMPNADYTGPFQNLVNPSAPEGGDNENAFPFANQQGQQVAQMAPGAVAPEAIDDLAINYLQNPYYAYSGFGNQYSPYGYAPGTLVDLLQTRGMTQPEQADTLGLFGTPTDFS